MPDLLLLDTDVVVADAWHRVTAPGGYEWWHFDAQDPTGSVLVVADFHAGFVFHPQYLRRFHLYQQKPTRHSPPSPMEYCCAQLAVYENGRRLGAFTRRYRPEKLWASTSDIEVTIGPNRLTTDGGALRLHAEDPTGLRADLAFRPRLAHPPAEQIILSRHRSYTDHHFWIVANPLCEVGGEIRLPTGRTIPLSGVGYHDHLYGTGPLGSGLWRWMSGRVLQENKAIGFQISSPQEAEDPEQAHLFMADRSSAGAIAAARVTWGTDRLTRWGLAYPTGLEIDPALILRQPRVLESSAYSLRIVYDAFVDGEAACALCQLVYPQRLGWPVLGRLIERSIMPG
jgi:hypothetical protein